MSTGDKVLDAALEAFKQSLAQQLRGMTLDETPGGVNNDPVSLAQERGRREGWNMMIRHIARALEGK